MTQKVIDAMLERYRDAVDACGAQRAKALDDLKFYAGEQWPQGIAKKRQISDRPMLTINMLPQFVKQITNAMRQAKPRIKVRPFGGEDKELARIYEGLIRYIENESNATVAYESAFEGAVVHGFGFFRILTGYEDHTSFDQRLAIRRINDPFSVIFDPRSEARDGRDAEFAFVVERISRKEFDARYPDAEPLDAFGGGTDWFDDETVQLAEYWRIEYEPQKLYLISDGVVLADDPQGLGYSAVREVAVPRVKWCITNGTEILDEGEWAGNTIPIIPVYGDELFIDGQRELLGIVRNAADVQRMYNYWKTTETELIALSPKAPFIVAEGQLEGYEHDWARANTDTLPYLQYRPATVSGDVLPPPQRQQFAQVPAGVFNASIAASEDLKKVIGVQDAALGIRTNETSGVAINARKLESDRSVYHYTDNLSYAMKRAGEILVEMIPHVYTGARALRIVDEDGTSDTVTVNRPLPGGGVENNIRAGKYDVVVSAGPSYATRRQETAAEMYEFMRAVPQSAPLVADLIARMQDWEDSDKVADRLRALLPESIRAEAPDDQIVPPEIVQILEQQKAVIEKLNADLQYYQKQADDKSKELVVSIEREKIKAETDIAVAKINAHAGITEEMIKLQKDVKNQIDEIKRVVVRETPTAAVPAESATLPAQMAMMQKMEDGDVNN